MSNRKPGRSMFVMNLAYYGLNELSAIDLVD